MPKCPHIHPLAAHGRRTATGPIALTFTLSQPTGDAQPRALLPHIHALSLPTGTRQPRALSHSHSHPLAAQGKRAADGPSLSRTHTLTAHGSRTQETGSQRGNRGVGRQGEMRRGPPRALGHRTSCSSTTFYSFLVPERISRVAKAG
jgi:hypothetical protein